MNGTYDPWLVGLSIAVAVMASYVALDLASRVTASVGRTARYWLVAGAVSMGMGIWAMHFIAMLAFRLPIPMSYSVPITALSLLIAMVVSGFALHTVSRVRLGSRRLLGGSVLMGIGIAAMHYTGMAAMQMRPPVHYVPWIFALSILVAIVVSLAALWLAFQLRGETLLSGFWRKVGSALLMGAAICSMHYTGMAAAIFPPHSMLPASAPGFDSGWLAGAIGVFTLMLLATTLLVSLLDVRRMRDLDRAGELNVALRTEISEHERVGGMLLASKDQARAVFETAHDAYVAIDSKSEILEWNRQAENIFGWPREEAVGRHLEIIIPVPYREAHSRGIERFLATGEGPVLSKRIEARGAASGGPCVSGGADDLANAIGRQLQVPCLRTRHQRAPTRRPKAGGPDGSGRRPGPIQQPGGGCVETATDSLHRVGLVGRCALDPGCHWRDIALRRAVARRRYRHHQLRTGHSQ